MKKFMFAIAMLAATVAQSASAALLTYSQAQLLGMTIDASRTTGYIAANGTGILTAAPTFEDGVTPMQGTAGATGGLNLSASPAIAYYGLSAADLASFVAGAAAGDILSVGSYNDNNQGWDVGIWYDTTANGSGIVTDTLSLLPGNGGVAQLVLPNPATITAAGVVVIRTISQPDDFHASWAPVPEATSVAVWGGLSLLGLVGRRRRG